MGMSDTLIAAGEGGATGAATGAQLGTLSANPYGVAIGAVAGFIIGAVAGGIEGKITGDEKDEAVAKQDQAVSNQQDQQQIAANQQARAMYTKAMQNPGATSDLLFKKAALTRDASTGFADIKDTGHPFTDAPAKAARPVIGAQQFYGNNKA